MSFVDFFCNDFSRTPFAARALNTSLYTVYTVVITIYGHSHCYGTRGEIFILKKNNYNNKYMYSYIFIRVYVFRALGLCVRFQNIRCRYEYLHTSS